MGREFLGLFEEWADTYDESVAGYDPQYKAVFEHYDTILNEVTNHAGKSVLEFGVGTGNLSEKLLSTGKHVIGIEPSFAMREIAGQKLPELNILEGDFINFPIISADIDTIVSTYAFHHLTNMEKRKAIKQFYYLLPQHGNIVFADTMFESELMKEKAIKDAENSDYMNLATDLKREYYPTINEMRDIFYSNHFAVTFEQLNDFVWLVIADKC